MKSKIPTFLIAFLFFSVFGSAQESENATVLKVIFNKYYQNEKAIKAGRLQLLNFYCQKAPNNEEVFEVINGSPFLKKYQAEIKKQVGIKSESDWKQEMTLLFATENQYLKSKVNDCLSMEEFKVVSDRFHLNNQRLMIVSKPIYFGAKYVLIKVAFYRNIEHNSSSFLLMEKSNSVWTVKEILNAWAT